MEGCKLNRLHYFIFSEKITVRKLIGAAVIIAGIVLIVTADREETERVDIKTEDENNGE